MAEQRKQVVVIVGPTGVGKTALSVALAKRYHGEIISGDSIQVYRGLNIGSAKVTKAQQQGIPHHLIDEYEVTQEYNVKLFQQRCRQCIEEISAKGGLPIVCGGTGLYIKAALYDYVFQEEQTDSAYLAFLDTLSNEELYGALTVVDREACKNIHPHNRRRLIRALSIAHSGEKKSDIVARQSHTPLYDVFWIGLTMPREQLYARIDQRVEQMMEEGLLDEVRAFAKEDAIWSLNAFQGIGYKEWRAYFQGESSVQACVAAIQKHSRNFAKRQYTWFRNQLDVRWYDISEEGWQRRVDEDLRGWRTWDGTK